jgi:urocanate hydratase
MRPNREKKVAVVFVVNVTNSMKNFIPQLREKVEDIAFSLHFYNQTGDFRFGAIFYRDPVDLKSDKNDVFDLTNSRDSLSEWLETIEVKVDSDGPEDFVGVPELVFHNI